MGTIENLEFWKWELQDDSRPYDPLEPHRVLGDILDYLITREKPASE